MGNSELAVSDGTREFHIALPFVGISADALLALYEAPTGGLDDTMGPAIVEVAAMEMDPDLREELAAWEAAGDEAFYLIEKLSE